MAKVPVVPPMKRKHIEMKAENLVRENFPQAWSGSEPVPVDFLFDYGLKDLGIKTLYGDVRSWGVQAHGYTNSTQKISIIDRTLADSDTIKGRRFFRSTVGHELGHCYLHVPLERWRESLQVMGVSLNRERSHLKAFEDPEWQAWCFCKGLCMPSHLVQRYAERYGTGDKGIYAMMEGFDMNRTFVISRLRSLKMIPRPQANVDGVQKYARNPKRSGDLAEA